MKFNSAMHVKLLFLSNGLVWFGIMRQIYIDLNKSDVFIIGGGGIGLKFPNKCFSTQTLLKRTI